MEAEPLGGSQVGEGLHQMVDGTLEVVAASLGGSPVGTDLHQMVDCPVEVVDHVLEVVAAGNCALVDMGLPQVVYQPCRQREVVGQ